MWRFVCLILASLIAFASAARAAVPVTLKGSPDSMQRQHGVAEDNGYAFAESADDLYALVQDGTLVGLQGNDDYRLRDPWMAAVALPEVRLFVERLGQQYRAATGEQLVVTSLTRPKQYQPSNAHALSVHPAGMAIDLRVSQQAASRRWLEDTLLSLESKGVLDATRERSPPHYHVALFPGAYRDHVENLIGPEALALALRPPAPEEPEEVAADPAEEPDTAPLTEEPAQAGGSGWLLLLFAPVGLAVALTPLAWVGARPRR